MTRKIEALGRVGVAALATLAAALLMVAGWARTAAAQDDPPSRVAQLNLAQGAVSFQASGEKDWVDADTNRPLTTGDSLWADQNARGELHVGSTSLRIGSQTGITFLNLDDRTVQIQLSEGTLEITLRQLEAGDAYEVDTPNVAVSVLQPGEYRIDVDPNGQTTIVTVRQGQTEVSGGGSEFSLVNGQQATYSGTDTVSQDIGTAGPPDDFEAWCESRDQQEDNSVSARYVSRGVTGYSELDAYGTWESVPDYGMVWVPSGVPAGWAPYHYGHWVWIDPWGWTWVDSMPWGFAPFHYGRWAYGGVGWYWVPGPIVVRPVYAPALVAFVGGGGFRVGVGVGAGPIGWFPLGPRDVFVPAYHCSPRYVDYVNVTNTRVVNVTYVNDTYARYQRGDVGGMTYMNRDARNAVVVVDRDTFVNARPVDRAALHVTPEQLRSAQVVRVAPVAPQRQSIMQEGRPARAVPPAAVQNRKVVARIQPPPPAVPFERKAPELAKQPGRPLPPEQVDQLRKPQEEYQHPNVKTPPPVRTKNNAARPRPAKPARAPRPSKPSKPGKPHGSRG